MEGLSSSGNIQGCPANTLIAIFKSKSISPALKWVDNFVLFHTPSSSFINTGGTTRYTYPYDLSAVMDVTNYLGILWHPIDVKGHEFKSTVPYAGFIWDLEHHSVSLSFKKCLNTFLKSTLHFMWPSPSFLKRIVCPSLAPSNTSPLKGRPLCHNPFPELSHI